MGEVTTSAFAGTKGAAPAPRGDMLGDRLADPLTAARPAAVASARPAVQADSGGVGGANPQAVAASGIGGGGGPLPHQDRIQSSFGHHDLSGVTAHTDSSAVAANSAFGSHGFAFGNHVALATNDLHTVAHEAAHTVQQSEGVHLVDGVGKSGDTYEQHADKVADAVVAGRSAEALLDATPSGTGGKGVQLDKDEEWDLNEDLRAPDRVSAADTPVYRGKVGDSVRTRIGPTKGIRLGDRFTTGQPPTIRYEVVWHEWNSENKGYDEIKGYVDDNAIRKGATRQGAVDTARILPADAGGIRQEDVFQNNLSDCYFQAAMAAVAATSPQTIMDAVRVTRDDVTVTFYLTKENRPPVVGVPLMPQKITVQRSLLLDAEGQPVYGGKVGDDSWLWPAFMGKAWAVVNGSYTEAAMGAASVAIRALTGGGSGAAIEKGSTGKHGFDVYKKVRDALAAGEPVILGTGNFAKEGAWAKWRNDKGKGPADMPQGKVRNLHSYAVIGLDPMDLDEAAFAGGIPTVKITLRDPRDKEGATFVRKLQDVVSAGKFQQVHTGEVQGDTGTLPADAQDIAAGGIGGSAQPLPHVDRIQASFGHHDVRGVGAHTDQAATDANQALGSHGYASGDHVALATTDLHTVAHEAAHTVQQAQGVHLADGVGKSGDTYEQHADKVADAVVEGRSAEALLDATPEGTGGEGVQLDKDEAFDLADNELKAPDRVKEAATPIFTTAAGAIEYARIGPDKGIRLGNKVETPAAGKVRYQVVWHEWSSALKGFDEVGGFVDEAAIKYGTKAQKEIRTSKVLPDSAAGIKQADVFQKGVSDCYFQAAMAAVAATNPALIFQAFAVRKDGVDVFFYLQENDTARLGGHAMAEGLVRKKVTVEPSLLLDADGQPTYGGKIAEGTYLWPAFMSKAWAVVRGSYTATAMGGSCDAFRAITGNGVGENITTGGAGRDGLALYTPIKKALAASKGVVLTTGNFAKETDFAKWWNGVKHNDTHPDMPQGKVRNLHSYAVVEMNKMDLTDNDFARSIPGVKLTLRDPRDKAGDTFTRTLEDIVSAGKFKQVHTG